MQAIRRILLATAKPVSLWRWEQSRLPRDRPSLGLGAPGFQGHRSPRFLKIGLPCSTLIKVAIDARSFLDDQRPRTTRNRDETPVRHLRFMVVRDGDTDTKPPRPSIAKVDFVVISLVLVVFVFVSVAFALLVVLVVVVIVILVLELA